MVTGDPFLDLRWFERYLVDVPLGESGDVVIDKFVVDESGAGFHNLRCAINNDEGGCIAPGTYTRMHIGGVLMMSDTPSEIRDHLPAIRRARGRCLINGLGLGMVARAMLLKPEVEHVTVVELSPHVIKLVGPTLVAEFGDRIEIVEADAFEYKPPRGVRYGVVWHDIWPTICEDNRPEMIRLARKYGRRADWQGSWRREWIEKWAARDRARDRAMRRFLKGVGVYDKLAELEKFKEAHPEVVKMIEGETPDPSATVGGDPLRPLASGKEVRDVDDR